MKRTKKHKQSEREQVLALGLYLALTAPTKAKAAKCAAMADKIAIGMNPVAVERAKVIALARAKKMGGSR